MPGYSSAATATARIPGIPFSSAEREEMILEHLPQVKLIAHRIHDQLPGLMSLEDLVSSGTIGLIGAIDRFDSTQGVKLRTFAEFKIRGAILDSLRNLDWAPRSQRRRARTIQRAAVQVESRLYSTATTQDIAEELGISIEECHQWISETRRLSFESLDATTSDGEGNVVSRQLPALGAEAQPGKALENEQLRAMLSAAIERMPRQERIVLSLMYHEELSLREISRVLGVHESRVSQIKVQALARMRGLVEMNWPKKGAATPCHRVQ